MDAPQLNQLSIAEYLEINQQHDQKYEYHDGSIWAMAGGSYHHGLISGNIFSEINGALIRKNSDCFPLNSEIRLHIASENRILYPDTMVVCPEIEHSIDDPEAITNPRVIIEVLSKSTEVYDRGDKFFYYRQIPSLQEYILIAQEQVLVEIFSRSKDDLWHIKRLANLNQTLHLRSIGVEIDLQSIYRNVSL